jgi:hypothetical protein
MVATPVVGENSLIKLDATPSRQAPIGPTGIDKGPPLSLDFRWGLESWG